MVFESVDAKKNQKVNLVSGMASHQNKNSSNHKGCLVPVEDNFDEIPGVLSGHENEPSKKKKKSRKKNKKSQNDSVDDLSLFGDSDFGLPAADIHQKPPARLSPLFGKPAGDEHDDGFAEVTRLEIPVQYSSIYSRVLSPPSHWRQIPIGSSALEKYSQNFPVEWYKHVLQCLKLTVEGNNPVDVTEQVADDKILQNTYSKVRFE